MPKLIHAHPQIRRHASGQAIITLYGRDHYLGKYGSEAAREKYDRLIAEWLANGRREPIRADEITISELILAFIKHADTHYRRLDGSKTSQIGVYKNAMKPLFRLYKSAKVSEFGPLALQAVREEMIKLGWSLSTINLSCARIRAVFNWAVSQEMIPVSIYQSIKSVKALEAGRSKAKVTAPIKPVAEEHARSIYNHVTPQVAAMIELALLTGMRAGEIVAMRGRDIDTTGKLWTYTPGQHKTQHHNHQRVVMIGPKARELLKPYLRTDLDAPIFSPAEADAASRAKRAEARMTPMNQGNRAGTNRKRKPKRQPGEAYTTSAFCRAIKRGCAARWPAPERETLERLAREIARPGLTLRNARKKVLKDNPTLAEAIKTHDKAHSFHPHQLRHTAATRMRKEFGIEAAQVLLGHKNLKMTEIYAEVNIDKARKIAAEVG